MVTVCLKLTVQGKGKDSPRCCHSAHQLDINVHTRTWQLNSYNTTSATHAVYFTGTKRGKSFQGRLNVVVAASHICA